MIRSTVSMNKMASKIVENCIAEIIEVYKVNRKRAIEIIIGQLRNK